MDNNPNKGENNLLVSKEQFHTEPKIVNGKVYSNEQINALFQSLLDVESQKEVSELLMTYFEENPFFDSYDPALLAFLTNFFDPQSEYGMDGVNAAARIISSLLIYSVDHEENRILKYYMNQDFYNAIWPFFTESRYVILIFQYIIYSEEYAIYPTAYHFLLENNILDVLSSLLHPDYVFLVDIICFIRSFNSYFRRQKKSENPKFKEYFLDTYEDFINGISMLIPHLCEIVFSSDVFKVLRYGCGCLGSYSKNYLEIGKHILENEYFQEKCKILENLEGINDKEKIFHRLEELKEILFLVDDIMQNNEIKKDQDSKSSIQSISKSLENIIIMTLSHSFASPNIFSTKIICFIESLVHYCQHQSDNDFINAIGTFTPNLCEFIFNSDDFNVLHYGCHCLGSLGMKNFDIGISIFDNEHFQSKCKCFKDLEILYTEANEEDDDDNEEEEEGEENPEKKNTSKHKLYRRLDELSEILYLIGDILVNKERNDTDNSLAAKYSLIRSESKPYNPLFLELIFDVIGTERIELKYISLALSILSDLYLTEEEVNFCIESELAQHLISMATQDYPFKAKISFIGAIAHFVEFSGIESVQFFINNGFFEIITDYLEELLTEIPDQIMDALENINRLGETNKECEEWCSMIFDNDEIVKALEKASNGEFDDAADSVLPLQMTAQAFLERRYNECMPD